MGNRLIVPGQPEITAQPQQIDLNTFLTIMQQRMTALERQVGIMDQFIMTMGQFNPACTCDLCKPYQGFLVAMREKVPAGHVPLQSADKPEEPVPV